MNSSDFRPPNFPRARASRASRSKMPLAAAVAARAGLEVADAEGALVVVATDAAPRGSRRVMHEWLRGSYLPALRRARANLMTLRAGESLRRVRRVAEADAV